MPVRLLNNPAGAFGQPISSSAGLNEQFVVQAINNSGMALTHGDVVVWDDFTAVSTGATDINGAATLTTATQSITVDATASFTPTTNGLATVIATPVAGTPLAAFSGGNPTPITFAYGSLTATTFAAAFGAKASATNGMADEAAVAAVPLTNVGLAGTSGDSGRFVTLNHSGAIKSPNVAGVITTNADAATSSGTVAPGADCWVCVAGVARVNIAAGTVAAGAILNTDTVPSAAIGVGTLGNMLGIALESQANKDVNNTIRAIIKLG